MRYPIGHPKIRDLAQQAVGNAKRPADKVKRILNFVAEYLTPNYEADHLTVMDVLKEREGGGREYALLFATLARAAGVPAREVNGLAYVGDRSKGFARHTWNEVVLNGAWVPVDPIWKEIEIDATHIAFGSDDSAFDAFSRAAAKQLTLKLVDVKHADLSKSPSNVSWAEPPRIDRLGTVVALWRLMLSDRIVSQRR
jgi:hypothetical protein